MTHTPDTGRGAWPLGTLDEQVGLINWRIGVWNDLGYADPAPGQTGIPPLGERSAEAIAGGRGAIEAIDDLVGRLSVLRGQLVSEMRADEDARAARVPLESEGLRQVEAYLDRAEAQEPEAER